MSEDGRLMSEDGRLRSNRSAQRFLTALACALMVLGSFYLGRWSGKDDHNVPVFHPGSTYEFDCGDVFDRGDFVEVSDGWIRFDMKNGGEGWFLLRSCSFFERQVAGETHLRDEFLLNFPDYDVDAADVDLDLEGAGKNDSELPPGLFDDLDRDATSEGAGGGKD